MFSHIMVGANDIQASKKFYDAIFGALGIPAGTMDEKGRVFYMTKTGVFGITIPFGRRHVRGRAWSARPSAGRLCRLSA